MQFPDASDFKTRRYFYMRTALVRLPVLLLLGAIQVSRQGLFHYVGIFFFIWAAVESLAYLAMKQTRKL